MAGRGGQDQIDGLGGGGVGQPPARARHGRGGSHGPLPRYLRSARNLLPVRAGARPIEADPRLSSPDYDCAPTRRYPVFYFNDGHDLFEGNPLASDLDPVLAAEIAAREGWYGSWRLNRQLDRAIADGRLPPLIAVGIASDDGMRSRDLAPVPWSASGEGRGTKYGDFIAQAVVAAVDSRFRTLVDRRCRGIGGASLGAVSALQIGLTHPDRFGLVLAFSPVLHDPALARYLAARWGAADHAGAPAVLIDFDDDPVGAADLEWFASVVAPDTGGGQATLLQTPGGRHTIASWAKRVIPGLMQLFDGQCDD